MSRKPIRDETGMAMGITLVMIVLISVMGAGLLTFVMRDIDSVIETNRGQRAMDMADAGVQAAKAHLRVDSFREHYDTSRANDCEEGPRVGGDNWSKATDIYTAANGSCVGLSTRTDVGSTPWREDQGVTKLFGGGRFHVTIECYDQSGDSTPVPPSTTSPPDPCNGGATGSAPENVLASEKKFFKITSTGYDNPTGSGTIRKVEAIYSTAKRTYAPIAYWTPKNIAFDGTSCVKKMSFFAGGNILGATGGNSACGPSASPYASGRFIADRRTDVTPLPADAIYGDWYNADRNTNRRVNASGTPLTKVGFGALGLICSSSNPNSCTSDANSVANGYDDYDRTTGTKGQNKRMVATAAVPTPGDRIAFPFDPGNALADPSSVVDPGLVEEMRVAALEQGNLLTGAQTMNTWPAEGAIVFVEGGDVTFRVNSTPKAEGVLIVRNGNFTFNNSSNGFQGVIIVIGNGTTTGTYFQSGGVDLDGYVSASGNIDIRGNVSPSTTIDYTNLNTFYDLKLWSWRERYQ